MVLTAADMKSIHPVNNRVVVRPLIDTTKRHDTSLDLMVPTMQGEAFDQFRNAPIVCEVVSVPRRLFCATRRIAYESVVEMDLDIKTKIELIRQRRQTKYTETTMIDSVVPNTMMWHTPVQVRTGDTVWVNANAIIQAATNGMMVEDDGQKFYLIPYEDLYLKKSPDGVTMLNGWVLAAPVEESPDWADRLEKAGLVVPAHLKKQPYNDRLAVVRYIGDPVQYLRVGDDQRFDPPDVAEGDMVLLKRRVNRRLEPGAKFFAKDNIDYIVTRRCEFRAVVN